MRRSIGHPKSRLLEREPNATVIAPELAMVSRSEWSYLDLMVELWYQSEDQKERK